MNTVKNIYNFVKNNLLLVFGAIIGVLTLIISLKNKRIEVLETSEALQETKATDKVLTSQQEGIKQQINNNSVLLDTLQQNMVQLEQDKAKKVKEQESKTSEQVLDYWNKPDNVKK